MKPFTMMKYFKWPNTVLSYTSRAVEIAMRSNIPLLIKNTLKESNGTLITNYDKSRRYRQDKDDKLLLRLHK